MQGEAGGRRHDAAAEFVADGVDEGAGIAFCVDGGEVDGVACVMGWRAVSEVG